MRSIWTSAACGQCITSTKVDHGIRRCAPLQFPSTIPRAAPGRSWRAGWPSHRSAPTRGPPCVQAVWCHRCATSDPWPGPACVRRGLPPVWRVFTVAESVQSSRTYGPTGTEPPGRNGESAAEREAAGVSAGTRRYRTSAADNGGGEQPYRGTRAAAGKAAVCLGNDRTSP
jgi:hypothetical protein